MCDQQLSKADEMNVSLEVYMTKMGHLVPNGVETKNQ